MFDFPDRASKLHKRRVRCKRKTVRVTRIRPKTARKWPISGPTAGLDAVGRQFTISDRRKLLVSVLYDWKDPGYMPNESRRDMRERFEAMVRAERASLVRAAAKILGDLASAEDVVQETLAAVWLRLPDISGRKLKAYLFRAVQFNALKCRARGKTHVSLDSVPEVADAIDDLDPTDVIDPLELEQALEGLPPAQQAVLRMKYYVGMTFREIGEVLAVSANTVSSRCRYAIAALRRTLGDNRSGPNRNGGEHT